MKTILFLLTAATLSMALTFTTLPSMTYDAGSGKWTVSFAVDESTDVEIAVINMDDSAIVRHLAAGVLGAHTPAPLSANALSQTLEWDGKDDLGNTVSGGSYSVRVRAGMGTRLDKMAGGNPYCFKGMESAAEGGYWRFSGIVPGPDNTIYAMGTATSVGCATIRQYDASGNYLKTVFPYPAGHAQADVSGFGVNTWASGGYSPVPGYTASAQISGTFAAASTSQLIPIGSNGDIVVLNFPQIMVIGPTGTNSASTVNLVTSPAIPYSSYMFGPGFFTLSHNPDIAYFSGYFKADVIDLGCHLVEASDTGFWRDGQIWKLDMKNGVLSPWFALDSVPRLPAQRSVNIGMEYNTAVQGTAIDDSGRVYVCDRLHARVAVYDTNKTLLGSVPVRYPDLVVPDPSTGALYVITRQYTSYPNGLIHLRKYSGWRPGDSLVASTLLTTDYDNSKSAKPYLALTKDGSKSMLWTGYVFFGIRAYEDTGRGFKLAMDFNREASSTNLGFDRITADPRTETVYIQDMWSGIFKVEDWANPTVLPCSTLVNSVKKRLYGTDMSMSFDGQLYVREGRSWDGPITRYDTDHYHAPINWPNTGSNMLTPWISSRYGQGFGEKGFAVAPDKRVAAMQMFAWCQYYVTEFPDTGSADSCHASDTVVMPITTPCGGVKYDLKGNLYLGLAPLTPNHQVEEGFGGKVTDRSYRNIGGLYRFAPGSNGGMNTTGDVANYGATVSGYDKAYGVGMAPFAGSTNNCWCRSPRFDVDAYGRIYLPNSMANRVVVIDNEDNRITHFGQYGNWDSQGEGSLVPAPAIPLAWPEGVAATDDYVYVTDIVNTRVVRVQKTFALDNLPGVGHAASVVGANNYSPLQMTAAPNPFNPVVHFMMTGNLENASLKIFDCSGRLAEDISGKAEWNAKGRPAGLYFAVLECNGKRLVRKLVLAK